MDCVNEWNAFLLNEEVEYIDIKKIDLMREYQRLNKLLYNGKLGAYPMKWNKRKGSGALVRYKRIKRGQNVDIVGIESIEVSTFYSQTLQGLRNRLAHEMIHIYWLEQGMDYGHNKYFNSEMNRINRMNIGVEVSIKEYSDSDSEIGQVTQEGKPVVILVGKIFNTKELSAMSMPVEKYKDMSQQLFAKITNWGKAVDGWYFEMYRYDANWTQRFPKMRKVTGTLSGYEIKKEEIEDLRKNGIPLGYMGVNGIVFGPIKNRTTSNIGKVTPANTDDKSIVNKNKKQNSGDLSTWAYGLFPKGEMGTINSLSASGLIGAVSSLKRLDNNYQYKQVGDNIVVDNGVQRFIFTTSKGSGGKLGYIDGVILIDDGKRSVFRDKYKTRDNYAKFIGKLQNWVQFVSRTQANLGSRERE